MEPQVLCTIRTGVLRFINDSHSKSKEVSSEHKRQVLSRASEVQSFQTVALLSGGDTCKLGYIQYNVTHVADVTAEVLSCIILY